jgi:gamma-glutamyltranspeptidase/glutathione hydrolase
MTSTRPPVLAPNGIVAAAHPLAAAAGLEMLLRGGNAVDAAVATAAALNVVEPYMSGIGGVGLMMITLADGTRKGLDYSGHAPKGATLDLYKDDYRRLEVGPLSPLVPGNGAGWLAALEAHGTMDRKSVFAPAIGYAEGGFPLSPKNVTFVESNLPRMDETGQRLFGAPRAGKVVKQPELARTFRAVVEGGADAFYRGPIADAICADVQARGGVLSTEDLAAYEPRWVEPVAVRYRGHEVATLPPPCCGVQYLETLALLDGFDLAAAGHGSADHLHLLIEAVKIAVADRAQYLGDAEVPVAGLLSEGYVASRRREIDLARARPSRGDRWTRDGDPDAIRAGDLVSLAKEQTTSFTVVDRWGNAVTVTQSLGAGFGSGMCLGGTGVFLNNFSAWFDLDPASPAVIGPNRRVPMCVAPAHVRRDGKLAIAIGTPGGYGILQTTAQMLVNLIDFGMDTQAAIEAPRFRCVLPPGEDGRYHTEARPTAAYGGTGVMIEGRYSADVLSELERRGHRVERLAEWTPAVGGGQGVAIDAESGARIGGADPRRDGVAVGH